MMEWWDIYYLMFREVNFHAIAAAPDGILISETGSISADRGVSCKAGRRRRDRREGCGLTTRVSFDRLRFPKFLPFCG